MRTPPTQTQRKVAHQSRRWLARLYLFLSAIVVLAAGERAARLDQPLAIPILFGVVGALFLYADMWGSRLPPDERDFGQVGDGTFWAWTTSPLFMIGAGLAAFIRVENGFDLNAMIFGVAFFNALPIWLLFAAKDVRFERASGTLVKRSIWPFFVETQRLDVSEIEFLAPRIHSHESTRNFQTRQYATFSVVAIGRAGGPTIEFGRYGSSGEAEEAVERVAELIGFEAGKVRSGTD